MGFFDFLKPIVTVATGGLAAAPLAMGESIAKGKGVGGVIGDTLKAGSQGIGSAASDVAGSIGGPRAEAAMDAGIGLGQTAATLGAGAGLSGGQGGLKSVSDAAGVAKSIPKMSATGNTSILQRSMENIAGNQPQAKPWDGMSFRLTEGKYFSQPPAQEASTYTPVGSGATEMFGPSAAGPAAPDPISQSVDNMSASYDAAQAPTSPGFMGNLGFRDYLSLGSAAGSLAGQLTAPKPKQPFRPGGNIGGRYVNMFKRGI